MLATPGSSARTAGREIPQWIRIGLLTPAAHHDLEVGVQDWPREINSSSPPAVMDAAGVGVAGAHILQQSLDIRRDLIICFQLGLLGNLDGRELERQQKDSIIPAYKHYPITFYAAYWATAARATLADQSPRQWLACVAAALWMFTDVVVVIFYTTSSRPP